jgi:uridine kinase
LSVKESRRADQERLKEIGRNLPEVDVARGLVIGICGGTGAGKTTISERIISALPAGEVLALRQEHYYKDYLNLPLDGRGERNFDRPDSFDMQLLIENVRDLREGRATEGPVYDFVHHRRSPAGARLEPHPAIIVDGILLLASQALRELVDFKLFVETGADVRFIRRMKRDICERGRTAESVVEQYLAAVRPMHLEFIEPFRRYADVILPGDGDNQAEIEVVVQRIKVLLASGDGAS